MSTLDLFADDFNHPVPSAPWQRFNCVFDEDFWLDVAAKMWSSEDDTTKLAHHLIIVPDASMYVPFQTAWAMKTKSLNRPSIMPRMMTLLDWAKSAGASDVDMHHSERVLNWMTQLRDTPQLTEWLGATENTHLFEIARSLIDMSDELSLHLLAGKNINDGEAALIAAVNQVFESNTSIFARQELNILLQCWKADVSPSLSQTSPVLKYLQVLQQLIDTTPVPVVWVVRNRPWMNFETWFWQAYAHVAQVKLLDVVEIQARINKELVMQLQQAWPEAARITSTPSQPAKNSSICIQQADNLEDEAQAIARQVLAWRKEEVGKIALVALDRQVSRRVWALLSRCGVSIRDDTGWLLATSRAACSWRTGLALWQDGVLAAKLLEWLRHPMVLSHLPPEHKLLLVQHMHNLALAQNPLAHDWQAWLNLASNQNVAENLQTLAKELDFDIRQTTIDLLGQALNTQASWRRNFHLNQWAIEMIEWGKDFGLLIAWQNDPAGQVWLSLLEKWRGATTKAPLNLSSFLRIVDNEVEKATFRPHDVADDVLLLPLGSTRMRHFDAVWLMGADSTNLPLLSHDVGLLNMAVRLQIGLPTYLDQQIQAKCDLIDLLATTPRAIASYCTKKDGAPNSISTWLAQWLRAGRMSPEQVKLDHLVIQPHVQTRSEVSVARHVPVEVSASDLIKLAACPYQYYVQQVLKTKTCELPTQDINSADKGNLWHKIIATFHKERDPQRRDSIEHGSIENDTLQLKRVIDTQLEPLCASNARYWAVREQFLSYVDSYIAWWHVRENEGWQVSQSESWLLQKHEVVLDSEVKPLLFKGKIDQIDRREYPDPTTGEVRLEQAIIDYKTGSLSPYTSQIKKKTDVQLAFYINLFDKASRSKLVQAGYVGISKKPVHKSGNNYPQAWLNPSQYAHDNEALNNAAKQLHGQVNNSFERMYAGEPLRALGELKTCAWCEVRGLCRKGYTAIKK